MGNPEHPEDGQFSTPRDSDMALLTLDNSDIEFCLKTRVCGLGNVEDFDIPTMTHGGDSDTLFFCIRIPRVCPSSSLLGCHTDWCITGCTKKTITYCSTSIYMAKHGGSIDYILPPWAKL